MYRCPAIETPYQHPLTLCRPTSTPAIPASKAGPAKSTFLLLHQEHQKVHSASSKDAQSISSFGRANTGTNIPPQTCVSDPNCICTAPTASPSPIAQSPRLCDSTSLPFCSVQFFLPPSSSSFRSAASGPFWNRRPNNPRIACLSSVAQPLTLRPSWRAEWCCTSWWCWAMVVLARRP